MEREKAIRLLQKEIDALRKNIQEDSDLNEEQRASLLESANGLRDQLNSNTDGDEHLHLLLSLFGYDGATIDDEDGERDDGDALATLAGSAPATNCGFLPPSAPRPAQQSRAGGGPFRGSPPASP